MYALFVWIIFEAWRGPRGVVIWKPPSGEGVIDVAGVYVWRLTFPAARASLRRWLISL